MYIFSGVYQENLRPEPDPNLLLSTHVSKCCFKAALSELVSVWDIGVFDQNREVCVCLELLVEFCSLVRFSMQGVGRLEVPLHLQIGSPLLFGTAAAPLANASQAGNRSCWVSMVIRCRYHLPVLSLY